GPRLRLGHGRLKGTGTMQILSSFARRFPLLALAPLLGAVLPGCMLDRTGLGSPAFSYNCTAVLRLADGSTVTVTNADTLLGGGVAHVFAESRSDGLSGTPDER